MFVQEPENQGVIVIKIYPELELELERTVTTHSSFVFLLLMWNPQVIVRVGLNIDKTRVLCILDYLEVLKEVLISVIFLLSYI